MRIVPHARYHLVQTNPGLGVIPLVPIIGAAAGILGKFFKKKKKKGAPAAAAPPPQEGPGERGRGGFSRPRGGGGGIAGNPILWILGAVVLIVALRK